MIGQCRELLCEDAAVAMSLNQLAILIKVVDAGSFSAAAKALHLSQPSVSNHARPGYG